MNCRSCSLATWLLICLAAPVQADCTSPFTHIWLSPAATSPGFAEVPVLNQTAPATLYVWARLPADETLTDISLNLVTSETAVFASAMLDNPSLGTVAGQPLKRFEHVPVPIVGDQIVELQGFTLLNIDATGQGIGSSTLATDPLYDSAANAWRLGSVVLSSTASTEVFLQVGKNGLQGIDGNDEVSPFVGVVFGDASDGALCAIDDREVSSSRFDALLTGGTVDSLSTPSVVGPYSQSADATLKISIGPDHSLTPWAVAGLAQLDGHLELSSAGYVNPTATGSLDEIVLLTAAEINGQFDSISLDQQPVVAASPAAPVYEGGTLFRSFTYSTDQVVMTNYQALLGDFNGDRAVDFADFLILSGNFGESGGWTEGDATLDGVVAFADFLVLSREFGNSLGAAASLAVPEPTMPGCLPVIGYFVLRAFWRREASTGRHR